MQMILDRKSTHSTNMRKEKKKTHHLGGKGEKSLSNTCFNALSRCRNAKLPAEIILSKYLQEGYCILVKCKHIMELFVIFFLRLTLYFHILMVSFGNLDKIKQHDFII